MLRLKVVVYADGSLDISGALRNCFTPANQDEGRAAANYEVELPEAGAIVAFHQGVALPGQVAQRELLAPGAGGPILQAPTPA